MRYYFIPILILLNCCKSHHRELFHSYQDFALPSDKEINISYKTYNKCITYYFFTKDTLNPVLSRVIGYDEKGREKETMYRGYESRIDATMVELYDSSGKVIENYYHIDSKSEKDRLSKTFYTYDEQNRLIKTVAFDFVKRIRKDVDKGLGRPGGCIIVSEDYEKHKSWELQNVWNYIYDDKGKLINKYAPVGSSGQNRYLYNYDSKGRLIEERSLDDDDLIWIEKYTYYNGGYEYTRTWYEHGTRRKVWDNKDYSVDTFRYKTDKFDNIAEEKVIEEGGRLVNTHKKFYDDKNRITRHEVYNDKNELLGYYLHKYEVSPNPVMKNLYVDNN